MTHYFYSNKGVKQGPFTIEELSVFPVSRDIQPDTLIWFHGVENWIPAIDLPQFNTILGIKPKQSVAEPQYEPPSINSKISNERALDSEMASEVSEDIEHSPPAELDHLPPPIPKSGKSNRGVNRIANFWLRSVVTSYKKSFSIEGRTSVLEFASFHIFCFLVIVPLALLGGFSDSFGFGILLGLFIFFSIPASFTIQIRRLHDLDWSGWWILLLAIPYIGGFILLVLFLFPGTKGENKYDAMKKWYEDEEKAHRQRMSNAED